MERYADFNTYKQTRANEHVHVQILATHSLTHSHTHSLARLVDKYENLAHHMDYLADHWLFNNIVTVAILLASVTIGIETNGKNFKYIFYTHFGVQRTPNVDAISIDVS